MRECLDTSVIVKWFKEDESYEDEAEFIRQSIVSFEKEFIINEWVLLEIVRALVKSGYTKKRVNNAIEYMNGLINTGAIRVISVSEVKDLAQTYEIDHKLYASDAIHLATAIHTSSNVFWAADRHFKKAKIVEMALGYGVEIKDLSELEINDKEKSE
jgi:predicted nucleic acid-binding protein